MIRAAAAVGLLLLAGVARADYGRPERPTVFRYLGVKWCRTCHDREGSNPALGVFHSWEGSPHALAWEHLPEKDRDNPACLRCHTTGYGLPRRADTTDADLRGVQCEACHGPGSHYFTWSVMKDREKALERGMWLPTREVCARCHW